MKRLKVFIVLFAVATALPMAFVVVQTYQGVAQEEQARMRFFAEALFDAIETAMAARVAIEENRPVDAYRPIPARRTDPKDVTPTSPLATPPEEPYIVGYLQNNPDGSFQTPLMGGDGNGAAHVQQVVRQLDNINRLFNRRKTTPHPATPAPASTAVAKKEQQPAQETSEEEHAAFAGQFIDVNRRRSADGYLGRKPRRTEEITAQQALNVARRDELPETQERQQPTARDSQNPFEPAPRPPAAAPHDAAARETRTAAGDDATDLTETLPARFQVEVAPLQSVFIDAERIFIFRRIVIDNRIYRQGFILKVEAFLNHLAEAYFAPQPMSRFSRLQLEAADRNYPATIVQTGTPVVRETFVFERQFPAPFRFLSARLSSETIPPVASRRTLNMMLTILVTVFLLGLGAIYRSAHAMVDLSERRTRFVSSVTHELKTPLTNIRLYIDMLEQGIAKDTTREQDYLRVVSSESARLTRLINNVLELSRLEQHQRQFDIRKGDFHDVMEEVQAVMKAKLRQEGFTLTMATVNGIEFHYDREVMVQILINLIENSIKFGRQSATRKITVGIDNRTDRVEITVSDTGPGIPGHALKKIFDDFYRVEDPLTRTTGGTGIGLSLVKKFMKAMDGSVRAANNSGPGCTITLSLPRR